MAVLFDIHKCSFFWNVFVFKFLLMISWKFSFEITNFLAKIFHVESNINADIHYLLYTFSFATDKGVSTIYNPSNFLAITDHRTFGSISADNLQRTAKNVFNIPYPINVKEIQFPDNSTINSSNGILTNANISNCIVAAPEGTFNVGSGADALMVLLPKVPVRVFRQHIRLTKFLQFLPQQHKVLIMFLLANPLKMQHKQFIFQITILFQILYRQIPQVILLVGIILT